MSPAKTVKAFGYTRVSTADQVIEGFSLEHQDRLIRSFCSVNGFALVAIECDAGLSGGRKAAQSPSEAISARPALTTVLSRLRATEGAILVVPRLDRLSRDIIVQETIIERLEAAGTKVFSVAEGEQTGSNPTRKLIRQILGVIADYERSTIRERMQAGIEVKRSAGGYIGGTPGYGWTVVNGELVTNPEEAAVLDLIYRLHADGVTQRGIVEHLAQIGVTKRNGTPWKQQSIHAMLNRDKFCRNGGR